MRAHGSAQACYRGARTPEGICEPCREARTAIQRKWEESPAGKLSNKGRRDRYRATAKGILADMRHNAKARTE